VRFKKNFEEHADGLNGQEFKRFYRVARKRFDWLCQELAHLGPDKERVGWLTVQIKLAMTLRFLAGGSYLDIREMWGVRDNSFWVSTRQVIPATAAIRRDSCLDLKSISQMEDESKKKEELDKISAGNPKMHGSHCACCWFCMQVTMFSLDHSTNGHFFVN